MGSSFMRIHGQYFLGAMKSQGHNIKRSLLLIMHYYVIEKTVSLCSVWILFFFTGTCVTFLDTIFNSKLWNHIFGYNIQLKTLKQYFFPNVEVSERLLSERWLRDTKSGWGEHSSSANWAISDSCFFSWYLWYWRLCVFMFGWKRKERIEREQTAK